MTVARIVVTAFWFASVDCVERTLVAAEPSAASPAESAAEKYVESYDDFERSHWSLQPVRSSPPPAPSERDADRVRTPVDLWIVDELRRAGLEVGVEATPRRLVRRLTLDLLGLPPTPDQIAEYLREAEVEARPDAYERLVDRLLADPRYGERQAQHWLDVVRYAETEGFEYDRHRAGAWRYRDYVIAAWNADLPFDRFLREQLAGDESSAPTDDERIAAGFHRLGPVRRNAGNSDVAFSRNEVLTEMTDAVGAVFLGLTVNCARCHDHRFDPIRQSDYYRLQAFLAATDEHDVALAPPDAAERWQAETRRIKDELQKIRERMQEATGEARDRLAREYKQVEATLPEPLPTISSVRNRPDWKASVRLLDRGEQDRPRAAVGPRPLGVLVGADLPELSPDVERPKSRLADWLLDPRHPLVSRVLANRLWQARFGTGLVATPNDFGMNGAAPSHPRLLDWLAARATGDWRLKPLQRLLVTSAVYRQSSTAAAETTALARTLDPDNRKLWRFPRRRLDAEALRDALLAVSGRLDLTAGGPSVIVPVEQELVDLLYKPEQWQVTPGEAARHRRSIYLLAKRNLRTPLLETFDQPDLQTSCGRRQSSTHAPQALELLNGPEANAWAEAFADRLRREAGESIERQVELAFELAAGRPPTSREARLSLDFLARSAPREFALAILNLNALIYVE